MSQPTTKKIGLKLYGQPNKPFSVSSMMLGDIDDNPIEIVSVVASDGSDPNPLIYGSPTEPQYLSNANSILFAIEIPINSPELNNIHFQYMSASNPLSKVVLMADKGLGDPAQSSNWTTLKTTSVIQIVPNEGLGDDGAFVRLGLTKPQYDEKLLIDAIKAKALANQQISVTEALSLMMSTTAEGAAAAAILDNNGGYNDLRGVGLTDSEAILALAIANIQVSPDRYLSEQALTLITTNWLALVSFVGYAQTHGQTITNFSNISASIRANPAIYALLKTFTWSE